MPSLRVLPLFLSAASLLAQEAASREQLIEEERAKRGVALKPERTSKWEERIRVLLDQKIPQRFSQGFNGLRVKTGAMITGGGFAIGPEYYRGDLLDGQLKARANYQISTRGFQRVEGQLQAPKLAGGRVIAEVLTMYHNYPGVQYYGPGPDSNETGRSNYSLVDTSLDGSLGVRLGKLLTFGGSTGMLWASTGPGEDSRFASSTILYPPSVAPAMGADTRFWRYGAFALYRYLDFEIGPRKGGSYLFTYDRYNDRMGDSFNFNRYEADLIQYVPFFNERRVFAFRGRTILTDAPSGQAVPFFLQPVIGGSDDLRGFRTFRFSDTNSLILNGEYRWEIFAGLDMAIFADAGKVFPKASQLNFHSLESSVGFGFRGNVQNRTFLRVDVGFSHEGWQVWLKFNGVFAGRTLGTSSSQPFM